MLATRSRIVLTRDQENATRWATTNTGPRCGFQQQTSIADLEIAGSLNPASVQRNRWILSITDRFYRRWRTFYSVCWWPLCLTRLTLKDLGFSFSMLILIFWGTDPLILTGINVHVSANQKPSFSAQELTFHMFNYSPPCFTSELFPSLQKTLRWHALISCRLTRTITTT